MPDVIEEEGADYQGRHLEFIIEGWCFHPPKPSEGWEDLYAESISEMRRLGVPFCKAKYEFSNQPTALPTGPCSRELVLKKARLLDAPDLLKEWDAASIRYRDGLPHDPHGAPYAAVSIDIFRDADAAAVAKRHGAKGIERSGTSSTYFLSFEGVGRAIDAIPGLLCDPDVERAAISGISK